MANDPRGIRLPERRDEAVSALFHAHHARLVGLARLLVDDLPSAEDVVQDAFTSLYRRWPWIRDKAGAVSYLQSSVVNGARSNLRRRRTVRAIRLPTPQNEPSPELSLLEAEEAQTLWAALGALPQRQRQVIVLRYYLEWSEAEIAHALMISKGSVKQHTSRAMSKLSTQLEAAR